MAETRTDRRHEFGHISTYSLETGDVLVLDAYKQQFSLTWSTDIKPANFVSIWSYVGADKSRMLIHLKGSEEPLQGYGYQLFGVVKEGRRQVNEAPVALIRLWLHDVSVTWQLLPRSQAAVGAVIGIATDRVDADAISSYFSATATSSIRSTGAHIPELLSELKLKYGNLPTLRHAAEVAKEQGTFE